MTVRRRKAAQRTTLADVAAMAGVSAITVSRFFNEPHRVGPEPTERIRAAVEALNYVPNLAAGGLASAHNRVVAMVVPNISGPIFADTLQALSDGLAVGGYQLLLASSYFSVEAEERAVRAFLGWNPAALVLTSRFHSAATERLIADATQPVIETWDLQPGRKPLQIGFSHRQVGRDAAQYLLDKGHRRIQFVRNSAAGDLSAQEREAGYAEVMEAHGLEPRHFVPTAAAPLEAGAEAMKALAARQRQRPEALIFANDNLACGALLAGQRAGMQLPQDMAVFGFGDYAFADKLLPSLSTIRPPARQIGELAAAQVLQLGRGEQPSALTELVCELVARESA
ncbi:LacI family DNA-binding transcriptional regulator [Ideonella azotifigens]|uniref:LacI family DNA-binding transcriptional regulator n=2 Tax=Ideonella azotifigens TaxID=513160 RepID=A0ABP3V4C8_9BURK|nr:LacI family DNA-binding transcriptional regulator [Ideonella azotifigens]MCD2341126.1 LacI family DNA-binding transcriptional regulator [Ideonella azotifigens]